MKKHIHKKLLPLLAICFFSLQSLAQAPADPGKDPLVSVQTLETLTKNVVLSKDSANNDVAIMHTTEADRPLQDQNLYQKNTRYFGSDMNEAKNKKDNDNFIKPQ